MALMPAYMLQNWKFKKPIVDMDVVRHLPQTSRTIRMSCLRTRHYKYLETSWHQTNHPFHRSHMHDVTSDPSCYLTHSMGSQLKNLMQLTSNYG